MNRKKNLLAALFAGMLALGAVACEVEDDPADDPLQDDPVEDPAAPEEDPLEDPATPEDDTLEEDDTEG